MEQLNCLRCAYRHEDNGNCTAAGGFCTAVPAAHCRLLQEYLGTGLTPDGVEALKLSMMGKAVAEIKEFDGLPIDRQKELAEADDIPAVDAVPVVRCGGCEYSLSYCGYLVCSLSARSRNPKANYIVNPDFFCAHGKRKEAT